MKLILEAVSETHINANNFKSNKNIIKGIVNKVILNKHSKLLFLALYLIPEVFHDINNLRWDLLNTVEQETIFKENEQLIDKIDYKKFNIDIKMIKAYIHMQREEKKYWNEIQKDAGNRLLTPQYIN